MKNIARSSVWFYVAFGLAVGFTYFSTQERPSIKAIETVQAASDSSSTEASTEEGAKQSPTMKLGDPLPANLFVELARVVNPSVVSVAADIRPQRMRRGGFGGRDPFFDLLEEFMGPQGIPREQDDSPRDTAQPIGTGFIIDPDGLILTNNHVVEASNSLKVQLIDNPTLYPAKVIGRDPRTDIALIKIDAKHKLPAVKLGSSESTKVGEWVAAFGNPYGHTFSMSKGIISAIGRKIRELNSIPFLQTDASINPGNSGGPLVNTKGEVIGVNSAIDARAQGIGFAIPIDHVKTLIPQLKKSGRIVYGYIGVEIAPITAQARQALKLKNSKGALIANVQPGGPAAKGGIQSLDVITSFGGKSIDDPNDLIDAVKDTPIGKEVKVSLMSEGKSKSVSLKVGEPPKDPYQISQASEPAQLPGQKQAPNQLGFKIVDYSDRVAKQFNLRSNGPKGPVIAEVEAESLAGQSGLRPGDIVLEVNRKPVKTANDVIKQLGSGTNILRVKNGERISIVFIETP